MVYSLLLLWLYGIYTCGCVEKDTMGIICTREVVIEAKEGEKLILESRVNSKSPNFSVVFTMRNSVHQCCYGPTDNCQFLISIGNLKNNTCREKQLIRLDTNRTSAILERIGKADEGLYEFFNRTDSQITACHVFVEEAQIDFWKITSLCLLALLLIAVIILYKLILAASLTNVPETCNDETNEKMIRCETGRK